MRWKALVGNTKRKVRKNIMRRRKPGDGKKKKEDNERTQGIERKTGKGNNGTQ